MKSLFVILAAPLLLAACDGDTEPVPAPSTSGSPGQVWVCRHYDLSNMTICEWEKHPKCAGGGTCPK